MQANHTHKDKPYTLEETLLRSVTYWCTKLIKSNQAVAWHANADMMVEVDHPFYPGTNDLISEVWIKILQPETKAAIEEIWNTPSPDVGGFLGVSKFISVVCTNALCDGK